MSQILSAKEDGKFGQKILLIVNLVWLTLEHTILPEDMGTTFSVIRLVYFMFANICRIDIFDHPETDDRLWPKIWKTAKVYVTDVLSMMFCVWAFGRSAQL